MSLALYLKNLELRTSHVENVMCECMGLKGVGKVEGMEQSAHQKKLGLSLEPNRVTVVQTTELEMHKFPVKKISFELRLDSISSAFSEPIFRAHTRGYRHIRAWA